MKTLLVLFVSVILSVILFRKSRFFWGKTLVAILVVLLLQTDHYLSQYRDSSRLPLRYPYEIVNGESGVYLKGKGAEHVLYDDSLWLQDGKIWAQDLNTDIMLGVSIWSREEIALGVRESFMDGLSLQKALGVYDVIRLLANVLFYFMTYLLVGALARRSPWKSSGTT